MILRPEIDFAAGQDIGRRETQEDHFSIEELEDGSLLLAVADGVGGRTAGQVASKVAILGFFEGFRNAEGSDVDPLLEGLDVANESVLLAGHEREEGSPGMGTTLLAVHLSGTSLAWVSVGDSPLFLVRRGQISQLNEDHSGRALGSGSGIPRNMLFSALTGAPIPAIDRPHAPFSLDPGDILLAATDGILVLKQDEIAGVLHGNGTAEDLVRSLLDAVDSRDHPRQDNTTVVLVRIPPSE